MNYDKMMLTIPEVAEALSLSVPTVQELIRKEVFTTSPDIKRHRVIPITQVKAFCERAERNGKNTKENK